MQSFLFALPSVESWTGRSDGAAGPPARPRSSHNRMWATQDGDTNGHRAVQPMNQKVPQALRLLQKPRHRQRHTLVSFPSRRRTKVDGYTRQRSDKHWREPFVSRGAVRASAGSPPDSGRDPQRTLTPKGASAAGSPFGGTGGKTFVEKSPPRSTDRPGEDPGFVVKPRDQTPAGCQRIPCARFLCARLESGDEIVFF